jgi:hypothetical protein
VIVLCFSLRGYLEKLYLIFRWDGSDAIEIQGGQKSEKSHAGALYGSMLEFDA